MINESRDSMDQTPSPYIIKVIVRATELYDKNIHVLQIGANLLYYKLGQTLLQISEASLIQIGASVVTNLDSYCKLGQPLLQIGSGITNQGNYYILGHNNMDQK